MKLETRIKKIEEFASEEGIGSEFHDKIQAIVDDMRKTWGISMERVEE
ncbi:hypothetical protein [Lactococcus fujiensis]|nr:hypothetical protein [Lactococcus fujiensis]